MPNETFSWQGNPTFSTTSMNPDTDKTAFQYALLKWYQTEQRPLPWRTKPSLYRTVVSELMAQQTQIKTMLPYFERWMQRFPSFETLAEAHPDDVLKHWEGLGYYSRARNLHKLAKQYVALNPKPKNRDQWQALPGIGPYTSAAISSIALNQAEAVVDGNVVRILARLNNIDTPFNGSAAAVKALTSIAEKVINEEQPGDHNQAMMELGATICLKHRPLCTICPVLNFCSAQKRGTQDNIPQIQRKPTIKVEINRVWATRDQKLLLHHIDQAAGQLAGQYELPELKSLSKYKHNYRRLLTKNRSITNRRITEHIYQLESEPDTKNDPSLKWIPIERLAEITLSGPHRRWIQSLLKK